MTLRTFADFGLAVYNDYIAKNLTIVQAPGIIPVFIIDFVIAFSVPILFSFLFTRSHPERRLVPPLPMQLVSFGLLLFFVYNKTTADWQILYSLGLFMASFGLVQDGIVTYTLGRTTSANYLIKHSLKVYTNIDRVRNIVQSKQFRKLNDMKSIDEASTESTKLRTDRKRGFILMLELKKGEKKEETIINIIAYHMLAYCVKPLEPNDDISLWAKAKIASLREILGYQLSVRVDDDAVGNVDSFQNFVLEDMTGALSRFQEMGTTKQVAIVLSVIFVSLGIGFFAFNYIDWAIGAWGIAIVLIADVALRQ